jgi:hypothetical protein
MHCIRLVHGQVILLYVSIESMILAIVLMCIRIVIGNITKNNIHFIYVRYDAKFKGAEAWKLYIRNI